jgi:hypothetical protein
VRRPRAVIALALGLVALALMLAACGGDDGETTTSPAPSDGVEAPSDGAAPPSPGALPPELVECFTDQGFDIESPTEIHSAPQRVVQECFGALHQGGGGSVP